MQRILPALRALLFALAVPLVIPGLAGCGLKGDLVVPERDDAAPPPAAEEEDDESGEDSTRADG